MSAKFAEEENDDLEFTSGEASSSDDSNSKPKESSSEKLKENENSNESEQVIEINQIDRLVF